MGYEHVVNEWSVLLPLVVSHGVALRHFSESMIPSRQSRTCGMTLAEGPKGSPSNDAPGHPTN